jgi:hypothetical protein
MFSLFLDETMTYSCAIFKVHFNIKILISVVEQHNILQAWASRPFSTVQKSIQQHPRSTATLDPHDL